MDSRLSKCLRFHRRDDLPKLAWCCRIKQNRNIVNVVHGTGVKCSPNQFSEGVWAGLHGHCEMEAAVVVTGSGAKITDEGVLFVTPSHSGQRVYTARRDAFLFISNSLVGLFAAVGERPNLQIPDYHFRFLEIVRRGNTVESVSLLTDRGSSIEIRNSANLLVAHDLSLRVVSKTAIPAPKCYHDYVDSLNGLVKTLIASAHQPGRQSPMKTVVPISLGYDSLAVASLASQVGCCQAMTFVSQQEDAQEVGKMLGLEVTAYERERLKRTQTSAEFFAPGLGSSGTFAVAEEKLRNSLVLTGHEGDRVWAECLSIQKHGEAWEKSLANFGIGTSEFFLRIGATSCNIPGINIESAAAIHAISTSKEMRIWKLGGAYDRPIPRRMIEFAGVPRKAFGQKKYATGHLKKKEIMSPCLRQDYVAFVEAIPAVRERLQQMKSNRLFSFVVRTARRGCSRVHPALAPLYLPFVRRRFCNGSEPLAGSYELYNYHWGIERILPRYRGVSETFREVAS